MPEESALDQLLKSGEFLHHLDMDRKTADLVFDRRTIKALYEFMSSQHIDYVDFPISAGKESVVFKVIKDKKPLVLKIYKLSTLRFSTIWKYIEGDYRFARERINRSNIVYIWAKKEYTNLHELRKNGILCPRPYDFHKNLLLMSYIGSKSTPAPRLRDADCDFDNVYGEVRVFMRTMYQKAKLVHADLSEYNILYHRKHAYIVDVGQSVSREHPAADYFLERDVRNISVFFTKKGVEAPFQELLGFVKGADAGE